MSFLHHTISKGTRAEIVTMLKLLDQGFLVFTTTCANSPVDLIALDQSGKTWRIQVKSRADGKVPASSTWSDINGRHKKPIDGSGFDRFAIVCGDKVSFVPPTLMNKKIQFEVPKENRRDGFWWWEDFSKLGPEDFQKRQFERAHVETSERTIRGGYVKKGYPTERVDLRKVERPTSSELQKMVRERPLTDIAKQFNVTDVAVRKWCKTYEIALPGRGYWQKKHSTK